jgi:hypothetical protein
MVNSTDVPVPVSPLRAACLAASEKAINPYSTSPGKRRGDHPENASAAKTVVRSDASSSSAGGAPGSPGFDLKSFMKSFQQEQSSMMQQFLAGQTARDLERDTALEALRNDVKSSVDGVAAQIQEIKTTNVALGQRLNEVASCATDVRTKFEGLEQRVAALEKGPALQGARRLNLDGLVGNPGGGGGGGPPGGSHESSGRFVPSKIFLRGWATFNDPSTGISEDRLVPVMEALVSSLAAGDRDCVLRCQAPYFRNWQGVFLLQPHVTGDRAFALCKSMNDKVREDDILINGKRLYAVVEAPAWKRMRNGAVLKAKDKYVALRPGSAAKLKCDFAAGELWLTEPILSLGTWRRNEGEWRWCTASLDALGIRVEDLELAGAIAT